MSLIQRRRAILTQSSIIEPNVLHFNARNVDGLGNSGKNSPLTTTVKNLVNSSNLTLNNFKGTTTSGYAGNGSSADPFCVAFDGVDDRISIPFDSKFDITDEITIEIVFDLKGYVPKSYTRLIEKAYLSSWSMNILSNRINMEYSLNNIRRSYTYQMLLPTNGKVHVVYRFDGTYHSCFINNNFVESYYQPGKIGTDTYGIDIGFCKFNNLLTFGGVIYLVRIYNRALTPSEITQNYNAGLAY